MSDKDEPRVTLDAAGDGTSAELKKRLLRTVQAPRITVSVERGPDVGLTLEPDSEHITIGAHRSNDVVLTDPAVSRFHCEVRASAEMSILRDLGSRNGTVLDTVPIREALLREGSVVQVGDTVLRITSQVRTVPSNESDRSRFGGLVGTSSAMRACYARLEKASSSDATVLLEGETGTGKGAAAEAIHSASRRSEAPFVIVDCGAIPANLMESELFGHEKGSFTGADAKRIGAFEEASGGTLFLDEVGELDPELQPKLLRALENRQIRRVGSNQYKSIDVRLIAATHRDLRSDVNAGRFRADLYFRLAVLRVTMPSLRDRSADLPELIGELARSFGATAGQLARLLRPDEQTRLSAMTWPGNVRELRNYVERALIFEDDPLGEVAAGARPLTEPSVADLTYAVAREQALSKFEAAYVKALLEKHEDRTVQAARAAGLSRIHLYRLARRHGIR